MPRVIRLLDPGTALSTGRPSAEMGALVGGQLGVNGFMDSSKYIGCYGGLTPTSLIGAFPPFSALWDSPRGDSDTGRVPRRKWSQEVYNKRILTLQALHRSSGLRLWEVLLPWPLSCLLLPILRPTPHHWGFGTIFTCLPTERIRSKAIPGPLVHLATWS